MTTLALVNTENNICENVTLDDRPANEVNVPGCVVLDLQATQCRNWVWNEQSKSFDPVDIVGQGGIGYTWDGQRLVQPQPQILSE